MYDLKQIVYQDKNTSLIDKFKIMKAFPLYAAEDLTDFKNNYKTQKHSFLDTCVMKIKDDDKFFTAIPNAYIERMSLENNIFNITDNSNSVEAEWAYNAHDKTMTIDKFKVNIKEWFNITTLCYDPKNDKLEITGLLKSFGDLGTKKRKPIFDLSDFLPKIKPQESF